ncbi:hypothetical protein ACNR9Q_08565 [Maribacter sp. X9]|uniref:hypothetical protein n=1 Tax=Maribacter sp. X9 TaxID=3402159 RepID=UPI003AF36706
MGCEKEKFKVIAAMIKASVVENAIQQSEYDFLCSVGSNLNIDTTLIDEYMKDEYIFVLPKNGARKVIGFYRKAALTNRKKKNSLKWIRGLYKKGPAMGLPSEAINFFL